VGGGNEADVVGFPAGAECAGADGGGAAIWLGEPAFVADGLADGEGVADADAFAFDALGDGLPEAEAADPGTVTVVIGLAGRPPTVDATFAQPAAIPMMRETPIRMPICLRQARLKCTPILIFHHPSRVPGRD
jgi:hypothetical protein